MTLRRFLIADSIASALAGLVTSTLSDVLRAPLGLPVDLLNMQAWACWPCLS